MKNKFLLTLLLIASCFFISQAQAQTGEYITINKDLTGPGATNWISFRTESTITSLTVKYADGTTGTIPGNSLSPGYNTFFINNLTSTKLPVTV